MGMPSATVADVIAGMTPAMWQAARLANGEDVPDAAPEVVELAARAVADQDRQVMDDITEQVRGDYTPSGNPAPRVSDVGGCGRKVWYRNTPPVGLVLMAVDERRATLGQLIHEAAEKARHARYPWRWHEFDVPIPGLDRVGRVDEYDPVTGEVTDYKSAGARKWEMYADGPPPEAWLQVMIYAYALACLGLPVKTVRIVAIRRDDGLEESFVEPYNPAIAIAGLDELTQLATMLEAGLVPPRGGSGPAWFPCSWCEYQPHCWQLDAAKAAGRSPESYSILGPQPRDAVVEWAAERAKTTAQAKTLAERERKAAAALLEGISRGTYGQWELTPVTRPVGGYTVPERVDHWVEVKPVRASKEPGKTRRRKAPAAS